MKLHEFVMRAVGEMGAAMNAALIVIGDKLGLYKAMSGAGPMTSAELAKKTGTAERYVREWLASQAAGGFVTYDAASGKYTLPPEQALALADETSPVFLPGFFEVVAACVKDEPKITDAFRSGKGVGWHEHDHGLFAGTERFFRPELSRAFDQRMDSCAGRHRSETESRRESRGHGLRAGHFDYSDGAGVSEIDVRGL